MLEDLVHSHTRIRLQSCYFRAAAVAVAPALVGQYQCPDLPDQSQFLHKRRRGAI
jgi:hypothetical protein